MTRSALERFLAALILAAIASLWLAPLPSELWLDETVTRWLVDADLSDLPGRAIEYQWSPLYFLLPWATLRLGGASQEILLRAPSVLAMAVACWGVVRIGRRLWDAETGLLAGIVFVTTEQIAFAAVDARPYATGLAFVVFSMDRYLLWRETGALRQQLTSIGLAGLAVYTHPLFALIFAVQGVDLVVGATRGRISWKTVFVHGGLLTGALLPMLPIFVRLGAERESLSWAATPGMLDLARALAPVTLCVAVAAGLVLSRALGRSLGGALGGSPGESPGRSLGGWAVDRHELRPPGALVVLVAWWLVPILLLFAVSRLTPTQLFVPKYYATAAPGFALLLACGLRAFVSAPLRPLVALAITVAILIQSFGTTHRVEGWREASRAVTQLDLSDRTPILIRGGLIESLRPEWLESSERIEYLLAPLSAYPIEGNVIPLPAHVGTAAARHYMDVRLGGRLVFTEAFVTVSATGFGVDVWLHRWAVQHGFRRERIGSYGILEVSRYQR
jgi:4-amino-4-deoxy-L-arabinose transferase-like glycosyltransferase